MIDLEDGKSALKLTTASYHRPSGKNIHRFPDSKESDEWGVTPDDGYVIKYSLADMRKYQEDRHLRDIPGAEAPKDGFEDTQLEAAEKYIVEQISQEKNGKSNEKAKDKPDSDEKPAPQPEKKKAANAVEKFPFFAVPKTRAG